MLAGAVAIAAACETSVPDGASTDLHAGVSTPETLDVNDVSILFPVAPDLAGFKQLIGVDEVVNGHQLITEALFLGALHTREGSLMTKKAPLRASEVERRTKIYKNGYVKVYGIRVDPCAASLDPMNSKTCTAQIRLIAQPRFYDSAQTTVEARNQLLKEPGGAFVPDDIALHLIYNIPAADVNGFVRDVFALKAQSPVATTGKPLYIHPALERDGLNSTFVDAVRTFVFKYADVSRLSNVARTFVTNSDLCGWAFTAGAHVGSEIVDVNIPSLGGSNPAFEADPEEHRNGPQKLQGFSCPFQFFDEPLQTVTTKQLGQIGISAKQFTREHVQQAVQDGVQIENPLKSNVLNTDCLSCHTASREIMRISKTDKAVLAVTGFAPLSGETVTVRPEFFANLSNRNLRNFGYIAHGGKPFASRLTINASALAAAVFKQKAKSLGK
jgi:hypothetical protein